MDATAKRTEVFLEVQLAIDGHVIDSPVQSTLASVDSTGACWPAQDDSALSFVIKVNELLPSCVLAISAWMQQDTGAPTIIGSAVMPFFSKKGRLKTGFQKLRLHLDTAPDLRWPSQTPGKVPVSERGEVGRLEQKLKQLERGELPRCAWLDHMTLQAMKDVEERATVDDTALHVVFQLPTFSYAVLYCSRSVVNTHTIPALTETALDEDFHFTSIYDPEVARAAAGHDTNPCEYKALKLSQALGVGMHRDVKPNSVDRKLIWQALTKPPSKELSLHERTLISKFRHYLSGLRVEHRQYSTIVPFIKCVDWAVEQEAQAALLDMQEWRQVDITDALHMLNGSIAHSGVRALAVDVLRKQASDSELLSALVQLVQCVRFDSPYTESPLAEFLVERCHSNIRLAVALHWTLMVEGAADAHVGRMQESLYALLRNNNSEGMQAIQGQLKLKALLDNCQRELANVNGKVAKEEFLRRETTEEGKFSDLLHLNVPFPQDPTILLQSALPEKSKVFRSARAPVLFVFSATIVSTNRTADEEQSADVAAQDETEQPARHSGESSPPRLVRMLFKHGDDLRQDQFVCQMISVIDGLLKRERIDLKLTPYWVLPMSSSSGILEFVPSVTLQRLTAMRGMEGKGILKFLAESSTGKEPASDSMADLRAAISPAILDNFIRSNAGYTIVTYLLDAGDRHLENLMLKNDGCLFHIDFGYVLGMRDPKNWGKAPIPLKASIFDAMGGQDSPLCDTFRRLVCEGFLQLRTKARELLTLLSCMSKSSIDCFKSSNEQQKTFAFAYKQFEDRLLLDVSDEMARDRIFGLIEASVQHTLAAVADGVHRVAVSLRS